jgi:hypothetical protein
MEGEPFSIALAALLGLLAAAGLARRFTSGWRRDALSVALVVLGLLAAFVLFFAAGTFVRKGRQAVAVESSEQLGRGQAWHLPERSGSG